MREEKATAEKHTDTGILFKRAVLAALGLAVAAFVLIDQRTNLFVYAITQDGPPSMLPREDEGDEALWFDDYYTVHTIDQRTFAIGEPRYFQKNFNYLIVGDTQAVLYDAGTGQRDIRHVVESLTDLPVTFVPSHLHYDHLGDDVVFENTALVNLPHLRARVVDNQLPLSSTEHFGQVEGYSLPTLTINEWLEPNGELDLGGRSLRVLYTPGHTDDSISLFDQTAGYLFAGDFLYPGELYGFLPNSNLGDYLQGTVTVQAAAGSTLRVFGAHRDDRVGLPELGLDTVVRLQQTLRQIQAGSLASEGVYPAMYGVDERVTLLTEPRWLQRWTPRYPDLSWPPGDAGEVFRKEAK